MKYENIIFDNFYVMAPTQALYVPLPLDDFKKRDRDGELLDPVEYMTIPEYLAIRNQTVEIFNRDKTMFVKGFGFDLDHLDALRENLGRFGLQLNKNVFILTYNKMHEILDLPEWSEAI